MTEDVLLQTNIADNGILHIQLNRPKQLNALSRELLTALKSTLDDAKKNQAVKSILISGQGKVFCAGADISELAKTNQASGYEFAKFGQQVFRQLETLGKPSLAAIHGMAFGGGCELAMSATMRIATKTAVFGQPEIKLGIIPGFGGTQRLSRLIGKGRAMELCLTGRRFSSEEAHQFGLVTELTEEDTLISRATQLLSDLVKFSQTALRDIIKTIDEGFELPLDQAIELEATTFATCCGTKDKQEGVSAFLEKRSPIFRGE